MRTFRYISLILLTIIMGTGITACSNDNDNYVPDELIGNWIGICHESRGTAYLSVSFYTNSTGELLLESPTGAYTAANFEYTVSGSEILCKGISSGTIGSGNVNYDFDVTFRWEGNRLIPEDQWTQFVLTKDGSIETNSNGDIL